MQPLTRRQENLADLTQMGSWLSLMDLAIERAEGIKRTLLTSINLDPIQRASQIGELQGIHKFFVAVAVEAKSELPPKFTEYFTGVRENGK